MVVAFILFLETRQILRSAIWTKTTMFGSSGDTL